VNQHNNSLGLLGKQVFTQQVHDKFALCQQTVWLIMPNCGTEGLGEPIAAFASEARANEAMELLSHTTSRFRLVSLKITA
jgi:hypothetical protein